MKKRGQIYILAALILIFVIFILVSQSNVIRELVLENDFERLTKNYEAESSRFVNSLLAAKENISDKFLEFTIYFTSYSKTQNPDFGLIYLFDYDNKLYIGNYLNESIKISGVGEPVEGCFDEIIVGVSLEGFKLNVPGFDRSAISKCSLTTISEVGTYTKLIEIGKYSYELEIVSGHPEIIIVSREFKEGQRKVFIGKGFKKGVRNE